MTHHELTVS